MANEPDPPRENANAADARGTAAPASPVHPMDRMHVLGREGDKTVGAPPGLLIIPADAVPSTIDITRYDEPYYTRERINDPAHIADHLKRPGTVWVDVNGIGDVDALVAIADVFQLHKLILEDIVHLRQRPKIEEYADHLYVVIQFPLFDDQLDFEQVSVVLKDRYVLSVQTSAINRFEQIVRRLESGKGRIRPSGADFLCYALIDLAVDAYFPVLEATEEVLEHQEDLLATSGSLADVREIYHARHRMTAIRRNLWGTREALNRLLRDGHSLVRPDTLIYLRDTYDHVIRAIELADTQREVCTSLLELHQTMLGQRMNEIMKVLTIMATIFIPLTFIAGIYGMNFDPDASPWNMPELRWRYGYPILWGVLISVSLLMLFLFRHFGWIQVPTPKRRPEGEEDG